MTKSPKELAAELRALGDKATPGPWNIYRQDCPTYDDIVNELLQQFALTKPTIPALVMLEAGGKCPALTGCGPTSDANAGLIQSYRNHHAAIVSALRDAGRMREAVRKAIQLVDIATDWNLDEVEIDGVMVRTHRLGEEFRSALTASEQKP